MRVGGHHHVRGTARALLSSFRSAAGRKGIILIADSLGRPTPFSSFCLFIFVALAVLLTRAAHSLRKFQVVSTVGTPTFTYASMLASPFLRLGLRKTAVSIQSFRLYKFQQILSLGPFQAHFLFLPRWYLHIRPAQMAIFIG